MEIQWFPGHMLETKKFLKQAVSSVDVVMEVLDARLPVSSANPLLDNICGTVPRIKLLNKKDLADPVATAQWLERFGNQDQARAFALNGTDKKETWRVVDLAVKTLSRNKARRTRLMVVGIPNTGKSTIINTLAGKKIARTGNTPAITRQQQRAGLKNKIDIYDTPGILWPVLENKEGAYRLAASGAISDTAMDYNDVARFTAGYLLDRYPEQLRQRYGIKTDLPASPEELITCIGSRRGCLRKGGDLDWYKASEILIRELRSGKIGKISLEFPRDCPLDTLQNS